MHLVKFVASAMVRFGPLYAHDMGVRRRAGLRILLRPRSISQLGAPAVLRPPTLASLDDQLADAFSNRRIASRVVQRRTP